MKIRALHRLLAAGLVGLFTLPAIAQYTRDASANQKIDEAINSHYLMMDLDKAEGILTGTVVACEDKCLPKTKAKAWMYAGIVRGSGRSDQAGAAEAFKTAKTLDPSIQLDEDLASPETKATWEETTGDPAGTAAPAPAAPAPAAPAPVAAPLLVAAPPPEGIPGDMLCSPQGAPVGISMPLPMSCTSSAQIAEGFVKFLEPGGTDWKKIELTDGGDAQWQALIPCEYTATAGIFQFYVGVKDSTGEYVDQFGSKKDPGTIVLAEGGSAPSYPGQPPVAACAEAVEPSSDCPPDFPGCKDTATAGPSCASDADCNTGSCVDGVCSAAADDKPSAPPFKRHWVSFGAGLDFMAIGTGNNFCDPNENFVETYGASCFSGDNAFTDTGVNVDQAGLAVGQVRLKLGYDFAIIDHLTVGARLGFAFLNTQPNINNTFLPVHAEGRVTYNITRLGNAGFRPAVYLAGGLAEAHGRLSVRDGVDLFRVAGSGFGGGGLKLGYAIAPNMVVDVDTQAMLVFMAGDEPAFVLHPSLSFTYGL